MPKPNAATEALNTGDPTGTPFQTGFSITHAHMGTNDIIGNHVVAMEQTFQPKASPGVEKWKFQARQ
jgi:hypothetical protein